MPLLALITMLEYTNMDISMNQKNKVKSTYTCPEYENSMPEMGNSDLMRKEMRREMEIAMVVVAGYGGILERSVR